MILNSQVLSSAFVNYFDKMCHKRTLCYWYIIVTFSELKEACLTEFLVLCDSNSSTLISIEGAIIVEFLMDKLNELFPCQFDRRNFYVVLKCFIYCNQLNSICKNWRNFHVPFAYNFDVWKIDATLTSLFIWFF